MENFKIVFWAGEDWEGHLQDKTVKFSLGALLHEREEVGQHFGTCEFDS